MNDRAIQIGPVAVGLFRLPGGTMVGFRIGRSFAIVHVLGYRQIDVHTPGFSAAVGLPLEWPKCTRYPNRWRVAFGPFSASWWNR